MKRTAAIVAISLFLVGVAAERPLAHWAVFSPEGKLYEKLRTIQEEQCLPLSTSTEFPVPESARILIVSWHGERPKCIGHNETVPNAIDSVVLLSKDSIDDVLSWYRSKIDTSIFTEFVVPLGKNLACTGTEPITEKIVVFTAAKVREFCWNRDIREARTLILKSANEVYRSHGYKTTIEFQQSAT